MQNKKVNLVEIEDVEKLYDQLLSWDKSDFIEKHQDDLIDSKENEYDEDVYHFNDVWEFVKDHDDDDILDEIGDDSCFCYLRNQWTLAEFIDALKDHGRNWSTGYTDEEILHTIDFDKISKDKQLKLLKQFDKSVIEEFLKNNNK